MLKESNRMTQETERDRDQSCWEYLDAKKSRFLKQAIWKGKEFLHEQFTEIHYFSIKSLSKGTFY